MTLYFEDFAVGQHYKTAARTILESDIAWFAAWSWDTNPVHTDAVSTAGGRFGGPIAHGLLGLSVAMGLTFGLGIFEGSSVALLGVDRWRFVEPIRAGDTVHCIGITSTRLTSRGDAGILGRQFTLVNQHDAVVQEGAIDLMVAVRDQRPMRSQLR